MGLSISKNDFPVAGRTVLITGGSRGTGLEAARQLAAKGANVVIVARDVHRLQDAHSSIQNAAASPESQRFHYICADLIHPQEAQRVMSEVVAWNAGSPPDIVWCCAGCSYPTLFVDTPPEQFRAMMDGNYFTAVYMAQAALQVWLPSAKQTSEPQGKSSRSQAAPNHTSARAPARHLIFTASFLSFYGMCGYSPYSPSKAALRSLSDSLSQEMNLYASRKEPRVRVHTVFPATIYTESYEAENLIKPDITKKLEEADKGQTAEEVARLSIRGLEAGQELVAVDILTQLVVTSVMGGSIRGGFWRGLSTWIIGCFMNIGMVFVRWHQDRTIRAWGETHGFSGMKQTGAT